MTSKIHLSATAIKNFKACPIRYRNANFYGIRPVVDTEAKRVGTNWHKIQEINGASYDDDEARMQAIVAELNEVYGKIPDAMDMEKLEIERTILLYSLSGYNWLYQYQNEEVLATEIKFEIPVVNPETGRVLPNVINKGMIDKLIRTDGGIFVKEHKSTSSSVDPDSDLWGHLKLDTQTNNYVYAARILAKRGELRPYGINDYNGIAGVYFDAWHKPGKRPKKLSQGDSKKFVEDGMYCGQKFDTKKCTAEAIKELLSDSEPGAYFMTINDAKAHIEPGKKEGTFAIKETPEMYGARLLQDITEKPEFYFACKELTKTDQDITRFEWELYNIYKTVREMVKTGHWYSDESQCEATFKCDYMEQCYNDILVDRDHVPDGMELIF